MVDTPSIANNIAQVTPPRSSVSPGQIAAPYQQLAENMNRAGEILMKDVAVPAAERAGENSVRAGPDGMPIVDHSPLPILGDAGVTYGNNSRLAELTLLHPKIENKLTEIRLQHANDPAGLQTAIGEYSDQLLKNIPDPALHGPVQKIASDYGGQQYRTALVQTDNTARENALTGAQAQLSGLNEKGASLARQGATLNPGTPAYNEYQQVLADRAAILNTLGQDPRNNFPKERIEQILGESRDQDVEQAVIGDVLRTYKTKKNLPDAQRALQDAFWGEGSEKLKLSPQKRDKGISEGLRALTRMTAEEHADTTAFRQGVTTYIDNLIKDPFKFDEIGHGGWESQASQLDDEKSKSMLRTARSLVPLFQGLRGMPPQQAAVAMADMSRGIVPALPTRLPSPELNSMIEAEAKRQGVPPELAKRVAMIESGGNPNNVTKSYKGIYQLDDKEFGRYGGGQGNIFNPADNVRAGIASLAEKTKNFRDKYGRDPTATDVYLSHQQGEAGLGAHLGNPGGVAWQNVRPYYSEAEARNRGFKSADNYAKAAIWGNIDEKSREQLFPGGVDTVTSKQFTDYWAQKVQGVPYNGGLVEGQSIFTGHDRNLPKLFESTVAHLRGEQAKSAERLADTIIKQAAGGGGIPPDTVSAFGTAATVGNRPDLIEKVLPTLQANDAVQQAQAGGAANTPALLAQIEAAKSTADPMKFAMLNSMQKMLDDRDKLRVDDPLTYGARNDLYTAIDPLNTSDPQAFAQGMGARQAKISVLRQAEPSIGPTKAFGEREGEAVKTALTQGDPKAAGQLLDGMRATLSPDNYRATMASKPMKEALDGMVRSYDPTRLNAGMSTLDGLYRDDNKGFTQTFGEENLKRLHTWQALKDALTPTDIAEHFKRAEDPSEVKARQTREEAADKENKGYPAEGVAWALYNADHGFLSNVPLLSKVLRPGAPTAPIGPGAADAMKSEFDEFRKYYRGSGLDADAATAKAVEKLKTVFGTSDIVGGNLMRRPPEWYYPEIRGSHDWMRGQIESEIAAAVGKPKISVHPGEIGPHVGTNWTYTLAPDARTEGDIASGRPPSYPVFVTDMGTGKIDQPRDANGELMRYRWDPTAPQATSRENFAQSDRISKAMNERLHQRDVDVQRVRGGM